MIARSTFSKQNLGQLLMPHTIFSFQYADRVKATYERVARDRIHMEIIFYLFILSFFIAFGFYLYLFDTIYFLFVDMMIGGIFQFSVLLLCFVVLNVCVYWSVLIFFLLYYDSKWSKYEESIEKDLPDFLDNLVSNLKGGFILEKALLQSVRADQKELLDEMTLINEKIMSGTPIVVAIDEMGKRFKSPVISRTLFLILEGLKGGGNMAVPLQRISENLKKIYMLNEEVKSNVGGFSMIIRMIGNVVAPGLFALAITLLVFIGDLLILLSESESDLLSVQSLPVEFVSYLTLFSYSMLILISVFSSLIISHLNNDEIYTALKSIPVVIILSCVIYYFLSSLLIGYFTQIL